MFGDYSAMGIVLEEEDELASSREGYILVT